MDIKDSVNLREKTACQQFSKSSNVLCYTAYLYLRIKQLSEDNKTLTDIIWMRQDYTVV